MLPPERFEYRPGLDGVRALAVVAVLLYHVDITWIPGGFLGVETFFVLSGYLITALLLAQMAEDGEVSLRRFWVRRARRLLPAAYTLIAGVVGLAVVFRAELERVIGELPAAFFYVYNWLPVLTEQSYFEAMGRPSPLQHLWSLAIEEQFYLLWPVVLIWALRSGGRRRLGWVALGGVVLSSLAMIVLAEPGMDPSRVYYGTDTRAAGLLIGALGAVIWHPSRHIGPRHRRTLTVAGVLGVVGLVLAFWQVSEFGGFLYRGGFLLISLASLLVTLAAADAGGLFGRVLGFAPLRWLGTRSYAIYLWHWPVVVFTRPGIDLPFDGLPVVGLRIAVSLMLAEISYRLVETRFRLGGRARPIPTSPSLRPVGFPRRTLAAFTSLLLLVSLSAVAWEGVGEGGESTATVLAAGPVAANDTAADDPGGEAVASITTAISSSSTSSTTTTTSSTTTTQPDQTTKPGKNQKDQKNQKKQQKKKKKTTSTTKASPTVSSGATSYTFTPPTHPPTTPPPPPPSVTAIGDSVMAGAVTQLEKAYGGPIDVDAEVGRSFAAGIATVEHRVDKGSLGEVVVVHLGNNGIIEPGQVKKMVDVVGPDRSLIFLTVRVPRRWQEVVNRTLTETVPKIDNARLVDWYAVSEGKRKWFNADGLHIVDTPGAPAYAKLIAKAVGKLDKG